MKKLFCMIICSMMLLGVSCGLNGASEKSQAKKTEQIDLENLELVRQQSDRIVCYNLADVEKYNDVIIIGTVTERSPTECTFDEGAVHNKYSLSGIYIYYTIKIDKVLRGDLIAGKNIKLAEYGGEYDGYFYEYDDLKPYNVGEQRIFCMSYYESKQAYSCIGDTCFPVPSKELIKAVNRGDSKTENRIIEDMTQIDFGVYNDVVPKRDLYKDLIEKYDFEM